MIVIDKLCYYSKLRYVNAGEKFAFAMATLIFCLVSRSIVLALLVLAVNGILTVKKGGIPFSRYRTLMLVPLAFLFISTIAIIVNISKTPLDAFAVPVGSYYITGSFASIRYGIQLILTALASVSCLYFLSLNAFDLPFYLCTAGYLICDHYFAEFPPGEPELQDLHEIFRLHGFRTFCARHEKIQCPVRFHGSPLLRRDHPCAE